MPLLAQKCSVRTPPVSPNRALTVVSKQPLNIALTAFQFGGQTRCSEPPLPTALLSLCYC